MVLATTNSYTNFESCLSAIRSNDFKQDSKDTIGKLSQQLIELKNSGTDNYGDRIGLMLVERALTGRGYLDAGLRTLIDTSDLSTCKHFRDLTSETFISTRDSTEGRLKEQINEIGTEFIKAMNALIEAKSRGQKIDLDIEAKARSGEAHVLTLNIEKTPTDIGSTYNSENEAEVSAANAQSTTSESSVLNTKGTAVSTNNQNIAATSADTEAKTVQASTAESIDLQTQESTADIFKTIVLDTLAETNATHLNPSASNTNDTPIHGLQSALLTLATQSALVHALSVIPERSETEINSQESQSPEVLTSAPKAKSTVTNILDTNNISPEAQVK